MKTILVSNAKGGTGKSTISTNLAAYYALAGYNTAILDYDEQCSSAYWAERRPFSSPQIQAIKANRQSVRVTSHWHLSPKAGTDRLIIDTPAGYDLKKNGDVFRRADAIIIPVTPSSIDIHSTSHFISSLMSKSVLRASGKIAVVANRVKENDVNYEKLQSFLNSLNVPFLSAIKDSNSYLQAAEESSSVFEIRTEKSRRDVADWRPIINWTSLIFKQQPMQTESSNVVRLNSVS